MWTKETKNKASIYINSIFQTYQNHLSDSRLHLWHNVCRWLPWFGYWYLWDQVPLPMKSSLMPNVYYPIFYEPKNQMRKLNMFQKLHLVLHIIKLILISNLTKSCSHTHGHKKKYLYLPNEEIYKRFFRDNLF